jgi:hypothetical protein
MKMRGQLARPITCPVSACVSLHHQLIVLRYHLDIVEWDAVKAGKDVAEDIRTA